MNITGTGVNQSQTERIVGLGTMQTQETEETETQVSVEDDLFGYLTMSPGLEDYVQHPVRFHLCNRSYIYIDL